MSSNLADVVQHLLYSELKKTSYLKAKVLTNTQNPRFFSNENDLKNWIRENVASPLPDETFIEYLRVNFYNLCTDIQNEQKELIEMIKQDIISLNTEFDKFYNKTECDQCLVSSSLSSYRNMLHDLFFKYINHENVLDTVRKRL
ncbi:hypothetical protein SDC9_94127 [bioreactor metagenome]|uniref:Uncharacterized protein n=1 Tax=bioreactor metagenome TaxID=1076179 RepID=A0A645A2W2_9ZZZZ